MHISVKYISWRICFNYCYCCCYSLLCVDKGKLDALDTSTLPFSLDFPLIMVMYISVTYISWRKCFNYCYCCCRRCCCYCCYCYTFYCVAGKERLDALDTNTLPFPLVIPLHFFANSMINDPCNYLGAHNDKSSAEPVDKPSPWSRTEW